MTVRVEILPRTVGTRYINQVAGANFGIPIITAREVTYTLHSTVLHKYYTKATIIQGVLRLKKANIECLHDIAKLLLSRNVD